MLKYAGILKTQLEVISLYQKLRLQNYMQNLILKKPTIKK